MEKNCTPTFPNVGGTKFFGPPLIKSWCRPCPRFINSQQFQSDRADETEVTQGQSQATVRGSVNFRSLRRLYRADDFRFFLLTFHNVLIVLEVLMAFSEHLTVESYTVFIFHHPLTLSFQA